MFGSKARRIRELERENKSLMGRIEILCDSSDDDEGNVRAEAAEKMLEIANRSLEMYRQQVLEQGAVIDQLRLLLTCVEGEYRMFQEMTKEK